MVTEIRGTDKYASRHARCSGPQRRGQHAQRGRRPERLDHRGAGDPPPHRHGRLRRLGARPDGDPLPLDRRRRFRARDPALDRDRATAAATAAPRPACCGRRSRSTARSRSPQRSRSPRCRRRSRGCSPIPGRCATTPPRCSGSSPSRSLLVLLTNAIGNVLQGPRALPGDHGSARSSARSSSSPAILLLLAAGRGLPGLAEALDRPAGRRPRGAARRAARRARPAPRDPAARRAASGRLRSPGACSSTRSPG